LELPLPVPRFFVERLPAPGQRLRLAAAESAHARVRRLSRGDPVALFDGTGREMLARVRGRARSGVEVLTEEPLERAVPGPALALYVAGVRAERLSWIAEKATELGASRIVLVRAERTQSFRAAEALRDRMTRVARAAAKQCGAAAWPAISGPLPTVEALGAESATHRFLLDPEGRSFPRVLSTGELALAVGPEGGWTPGERAAARDLGWIGVRLPTGRLRAETAAVAGLVLAKAALAGGPD
jgi:16S rRNA (uracil1498-N3)-methyltransferase